MNNKLITSLTHKDLQIQFTKKYFLAEEILIKTLYNYRKIDYVKKKYDPNFLLILLETSIPREKLYNKVFKRVTKYLIKYEIALTQFDILKILQEMHIIIKKSIEQLSAKDYAEYLQINENNKKEIKNFKKDLKKILYLTLLDSFSYVLEEKVGRRLHQNNINKIITIIENGEYEKVYSTRTLYYIFRNAMDLEFQSTDKNNQYP
jgi:hypothetical protein